MDFSTMRVSMTVDSTVHEDGSPAEAVGQTQPQWSCAEHGGQPIYSWEVAVAHVNAYHNPEGQARGNGGGFQDVTAVSTFHAVELETPDAE